MNGPGSCASHTSWCPLRTASDLNYNLTGKDQLFGRQNTSGQILFMKKLDDAKVLLRQSVPRVTTDGVKFNYVRQCALNQDETKHWCFLSVQKEPDRWSLDE